MYNDDNIVEVGNDVEDDVEDDGDDGVDDDDDSVVESSMTIIGCRSCRPAAAVLLASRLLPRAEAILLSGTDATTPVTDGAT
jgi:hypothetical protein